MLAIRDVSAGYEAGNVLHSVDVSAHAGELTVILGANGAGKTTLFRTISGILKPTSGDIEFNGSAKITVSSISPEVGLRISLMVRNSAGFPAPFAPKRS